MLHGLDLCRFSLKVSKVTIPGVTIIIKGDYIWANLLHTHFYPVNRIVNTGYPVFTIRFFSVKKIINEKSEIVLEDSKLFYT